MFIKEGKVKIGFELQKYNTIKLIEQQIKLSYFNTSAKVEDV